MTRPWHAIKELRWEIKGLKSTVLLERQNALEFKGRADVMEKSLRWTEDELFAVVAELKHTREKLVREQQISSRPVSEEIYFVFDGLPGPQGPRFIETERPDGSGVGVGEWIELPDRRGTWAISVQVNSDTIRG